MKFINTYDIQVAPGGFTRVNDHVKYPILYSTLLANL